MSVAAKRIRSGMAAGKTVTLFLMDGSPSRRIKCSLSNWVGKVYLIPRTDLPRSKDRPELNQTGIYLLFGTDTESGDDLVYVGQARERKNGNGVLGRVIEHLSEEKLAYFKQAILVITADDSFGPTEISYLENAFYQQAVAAARLRATNGNDPSPGKVTEEKQAELEEFIGFAKIAIGSLGYRVFDAVDGSKTADAQPQSDPAGKDAEPLLYLDASGVKGTGRQTADGFVVLQGSMVRPTLKHSAPESTRRDRAKYAERIDAGGSLRQDTLFSSPSAASNFLVGSSTSGMLYWKTDDGITLRELERRELEEAAADTTPPVQNSIQ